MTEQENAINWFSGLMKGYDTSQDKITPMMIQTAISALEKQVAKQVIETESYEVCPCCKSYNISFMRTNDYRHLPEPFQYDYCPDCGQKLAWEEHP